MAKSKKGTNPMPADAQVMATSMMVAGPVAMQAWQDVMTECGRFVMGRLQEDLETQKALLGCKSPEELMRVQSEFYRTAIAQYSEESARLIQIMSDAAQEALHEAKASHKRGYDDVPV